MESEVVFLSETQTFLALLHDSDKIKLSLSLAAIVLINIYTYFSGNRCFPV